MPKWRTRHCISRGPVFTVFLAPRNANRLVVETEGRKGTRVYTPDESEVVEGQEKATAAHDAASQEKQCMASWDSRTHITKPNWRKICERKLSDALVFGHDTGLP